MEDDIKYTQCQSIFRNLLLARGAAQRECPVVFIRELFHTARCDDFHDFSIIRKSYTDALGNASVQRIVSFDETERDERIAEQAVVHYHEWTERNLLSALSWPNWLWYHTVHKAERTVAIFGITGGLWGGWRFVRSSERKWQAQKLAQEQAQQPQQQQAQ